jgi:hypothetical protein
MAPSPCVWLTQWATGTSLYALRGREMVRLSPYHHMIEGQKQNYESRIYHGPRESETMIYIYIKQLNLY